MFVPAVRARRKVAAAGAVSENAAVFRRYPKRDGKGTIEWIHWADLELASAWAAEGERALNAFVAKYSGPVSDARTLEGGARAAIYTDARAALAPLNSAFQALNVPPLLSLPSEEFGCVNLLWSFVAIRDGRIEVRTTVLSGPGSCVKPPSRSEMIALKRAVAPEELASDSSVVVDVRSRSVVFRGASEGGLAFRRNAADRDRAYLALWARKPWVLDRGDDVEFIVGEPAVWERDRLVRKLQMVRPFVAQLASDPWAALVAARERVRENNAALAGEWMGLLPRELSTSLNAIDVDVLRRTMDQVAQARTERALAESRAQAREALATGAGSATAVLGTLSAAVPPAALVLAPAAAVLGAISAFTGLFLQVLPRDWLATAEVAAPRLPVPYMISGDESASGTPSHSVSFSPRAHRVASTLSTEPTSLDAPPVVAVTTMQGTASQLGRSARLRRSPIAVPRVAEALIPAPSARTPKHAGESPAESIEASSTQLSRPARSNSTMLIATIVLAVTATAWWTGRAKP